MGTITHRKKRVSVSVCKRHVVPSYNTAILLFHVLESDNTPTAQLNLMQLLGQARCQGRKEHNIVASVFSVSVKVLPGNMHYALFVITGTDMQGKTSRVAHIPVNLFPLFARLSIFGVLTCE